MENNKRPETMERITTPALAEAFIEEQLSALRAQIGSKKVLAVMPDLEEWLDNLLRASEKAMKSRELEEQTAKEQHETSMSIARISDSFFIAKTPFIL